MSTSVEEGQVKPPDLDPKKGSGPRTTEEIKRVKAKFWLDHDGKVYRFWFPPGVYKKGLDTPPARKG